MTIVMVSESPSWANMREPPLRKTYMGILKYHQTSIISYERGWPLACLEDLIKPNQASHQGARWTSSVSMLKVPVLALIIETSTAWPWYRRSFQGICRGLWIIIAELTCGLFPWSFAWCSPHVQLKWYRVAWVLALTEIWALVVSVFPVAAIAHHYYSVVLFYQLVLLKILLTRGVFLGNHSSMKANTDILTWNALNHYWKIACGIE
jgi:hypothetical protein